MVAASIIAASTSSLAVAYQISPSPNYGDIVIFSDDEAENYLTPFENFGFLIVASSATLRNYGDLQNHGYLWVGDDWGGADIENHGSLINHGLVVFGRGNDHIYGGGLISNSGRFVGDINKSGHDTIEASALDNSGLFDVNSQVIINGEVTNSGDFINHELHVGTFVNTGSFQNPFATSNADGYSYTQFYGETVNNGEIEFMFIDIHGGSLKGTGTLVGNVNIGSSATVIPGSSPGTLSIDGDLHSSGNYVFEIAGVNSGQYDVLDIDGNAFFTGGNFKFDFIDGFHPSIGDHWDFLVADSLNGLGMVNFTYAGLGDGLSIDLHNEGGKISLTVITAVPEPETYAMLLAGLGLMGFMAYRRKQKEAA